MLTIKSSFIPYGIVDFEWVGYYDTYIIVYVISGLRLYMSNDMFLNIKLVCL